MLDRGENIGSGLPGDGHAIPSEDIAPRIRFERSMAELDPSLRLYAILDAESCARRNVDMLQAAEALHRGGVRLLQYRDKRADEAAYLNQARGLRSALPKDTYLLLNDYAHLVHQAGADGVHIGQTDGGVAEVRERIGPDLILGVSTHSVEQALAAGGTDADYVAIGPVFSTITKEDAAPVVGLSGVQATRAVTGKPLVGIGGIRPGDARAVEMAGADAVAVISGLLPSSDLAEITRAAQDFLARLK